MSKKKNEIKKNFTIEEMRAKMLIYTEEEPLIDGDGKLSWTMSIHSGINEDYFRAIKVVVVLYEKNKTPLLEIYEKLDNDGINYVLVKATTIANLMEYKHHHYPLSDEEYKHIKDLCQE